MTDSRLGFRKCRACGNGFIGYQHILYCAACEVDFVTLFSTLARMSARFLKFDSAGQGQFFSGEDEVSVVFHGDGSVVSVALSMAVRHNSTVANYRSALEAPTPRDGEWDV